MMARPTPRFLFRIGRDLYRDLDVEIAFMFWREENPSEGQRRYRHGFSFSWNWPRRPLTHFEVF